MGLEVENTKLFPYCHVLFTNVVLVEILVIVDGFVCGDLYLSVASRYEIHVLAWRQLYNELLNEARHILIANNCAFPFFHAQHAFRHFDLQITFNLALTTKSPVFFHLFSREMRAFGVEYFTAPFYHLQLALTAASFSTTSRW